MKLNLWLKLQWRMWSIFLGEFCNDGFDFDSVGSTRFYNKHILVKLLYIKTPDAIGMLKNY